jgi:phenylalanyl-tRNA synthetase alpha chain
MTGDLLSPECSPERLAALEQQAQQLARAASTLADLEAVAAETTGRRSPLARLSSAVGRLAPEERAAAGRAVQATRARLEALLGERRQELEQSERAARIEADRLDLTEIPPGPLPGHLHLVTQTEEELLEVFAGMGFVAYEGPEAETDWYNFEALNMPRAHPARSMWDTFYLRLGEPETVLLRAHTSPGQIRLLQARRPPVAAVVPGRCFRRDTPDARHLPTFHQIEGLVVDRGVTFGDLAGAIETFTTEYFGESIHSRLRPSYFPFTEPSAEFEITCTICLGQGCRTCSGTGWVELGGCGLVHPAVLENTGVDPEQWSGFAFGFGIDRCAQMRHGLADLRVLLHNDVRFLSQF